MKKFSSNRGRPSGGRTQHSRGASASIRNSKVGRLTPVARGGYRW